MKTLDRIREAAGIEFPGEISTKGRMGEGEKEVDTETMAKISIKDHIDSEDAFYRKKMFLSMLIPGIFVALMWLVKISEVLFDIRSLVPGNLSADCKGVGRHFLFPVHSQ